MVEIHKDLYLNSSRSEMTKYIPDKAIKILDVGCSDGAFSSMLRRRENRELWGIEMNAQTANSAQLVCNYVLVGDFSDVFDQLPKNYFDCIIFNDVIEHMYSPWDVMNKVKELLAPAGVMISSIPNFRFIANLIEIIIGGDFRYRKEGGILDDTHIRFFTSKSIVRTYKECGFDIIIHEGINSRNDWKVKLIKTISMGKMSDISFRQFATVAKISSDIL